MRQPPHLLLRFFRWFCLPAMRDSIEGDLFELYQQRFNRRGKHHADLHFAVDVLLLFRPGIVRALHVNYTPTPTAMYRNYVLVAWRTLKRQPLYATIKIGGFALGLAACLLITLYVSDELSYDQHYPDGDRIYRLVGVNTMNGQFIKGVPFPAPMAQALREDFAEIEQVGRYNPSELFGAGHNEVRPGDQADNAFEEGFLYIDPELFDILQPKFVHGNPGRALEAARSIVISRRKAEKYFPGINPVGKTLVVNNNDQQPYTIGGVIEDLPERSHLQADFFITTRGLEFWKDEQKDWGASNYVMYLKLKPGAVAADLAPKLTRGIVDKYVLPSLRKDGMSEADISTVSSHVWLELQPIRDIHLYSADIIDRLEHGDIRLVWLFSGVAAFILLIACINFINLSTARSANRSREVGMRKVAGSLRHQLVTQFLTESVVFSLIAMVIGTGIAALLLPTFNNVAGKSLALANLPLATLPVVLAAVVLIGVVAGLYPAFYLASFRPIEVLKGKRTMAAGGGGLRSALVVFQFATSIILMTGTIVMYRQMQFTLTTDLGYNKEQVLILEGVGTLGTQVQTFKEEVRQLPLVQAVSLSDYLPVKGTKRNGNSFWHEGKVQAENAVVSERWQVDYDYIPTMGLQLKAGRNFDRTLASDTAAVIINETMARGLGDENAIGTKISNGRQVLTVIGVIRDFHFESIREKVGNLCLVYGADAGTVAVRINGPDMKAAIETLTATWMRFAPHQPIRYSFLDDRFAAMYRELDRTGTIFLGFSVLAIIVACLGLFALSAFMIEQRTKEVGIRLVLGANTPTIFRMLTGNFMVLVVVACLIATPVSWYLMQRWLEDYAYRISLDALIFITSGVSALAIAFLTVSAQSWKACRANPVQNLRSE